MANIETIFSPQKLEIILFTYHTTEPLDTIDAVRNIVTQNHTSKRLERRLKRDTSLTLEQYVADVFENYRAHSVQAEALYNRDNQAWIQLLSVIRRSVKTRLSNRGVQYSETGWGWEDDIVQKIAEEFFQSDYPYDVDFTSWIIKLAQNKTSSFFRDVMRPGREVDVEDFEQFETESPFFRPDDEWTDRIDLQLDVEWFIEKLGTKHRQQFARLRYQIGLDYEAIAKEMNRSKNTLYKLRSDTENELRKIFRSEWYN